MMCRKHIMGSFDSPAATPSGVAAQSIGLAYMAGVNSTLLFLLRFSAVSLG